MIGFQPGDNHKQPEKPTQTITFPRFKNEIVPYDIAIAKPWVEQCEPSLLPLVAKDYQAIQRLQFEDKSPATAREKKLYIATAGGPCSGKSTELDRELAQTATDYRYGNMVIVDPDRYSMEYMNYTYRPMLSAGKKAELGAEEAARQAYNRARPGSNIISNLLYNQAFDSGFHIAHGTTMTSPFSGGMLKKLGDNGYYRRLLLCSSPDDVRVEAGEHRINREAHYQVDPSDFVSKGHMFPARMGDYFTHGDHLKLLWKPEADQNAILAAEYRDGVKIIRNQDAYDAFVGQYQQNVDTLKNTENPLPEWSAVEQRYLERDWTKSATTTNDNTPPQNEPRFGFRI